LKGLGQEQVTEVPRKRADLLSFLFCGMKDIQNYIGRSCPSKQCIVIKKKTGWIRRKEKLQVNAITALTALVTQLILSQYEVGGWSPQFRTRTKYANAFIEQRSISIQRIS
jgi:hypothetical protein